jgi:phospholipase C
MKKLTRKALLGYAALAAMMTNTVQPALAATTARNDGKTTTPIKHVIIIVGENRTFDHEFATYAPRRGSVLNLLSEGIVNADGTPGPNVTLAQQNSAVDTTTYSIAPGGKQAYTEGGANPFPPIMTGGAPTTPNNVTGEPFATVAVAKAADYGLEKADIPLLTTGASGLAHKVVDTRWTGGNPAAPANAPFQISNGIGYDDYAASPVHRFYQMFQQMDCSFTYATNANPSGCLNDLFPWVEATVAAGSNGAAQPAGFNNMTTGEGSTSMGFYNVQTGDMPYFKQLADNYALGDNYHQPVKGGTGADSVVLGFGDMVYYQDANGNAAVPPSNQIENPNPLSGTNNWYTQDGYSGGTYTNCSDKTQPAVKGILNYLNGLAYQPKANCRAGAYYLLNNYNPGYNGDGTTAALGATKFTIPPQHQASIANVLDQAQVSWTYYGEDWNAFVAGQPLGAAYCNICNPFLYQSYVMTNPSKRTHNLKDTLDLYTDLKNGVLPAVSYVKPGNFNDGHPASSKYDIFEAYVKKIIDLLKANPDLWATTAVFITNDEGGGYYDSGFIQTVDFFGDGTRIPMLVVSPYSKGVGVVHSYGDHASVIKFVEANWGITRKISGHSRDNLPNPVQAKGSYVPTNMPAIDDLMSYFNFSLKP